MATVFTAAASLTLGGGVLAQDVPTVRVIGHENPGDAELYERIEAGLAEAGTPVNIELVGLPSSGYADICFLRLSRTVHGTAENRYGDRCYNFGNVLLDFFGDGNQVDLNPPACRTGNARGCIGGKAECFQQFSGHFYFFNGISTQ
jgi:hypothetical protein